MISWFVVIIVILTSSFLLNFITGNKLGVFGWVVICTTLFYYGVKFLNQYLNKSQNPNVVKGRLIALDELSKQPLRVDIAFQWPSEGNFGLNVVGESHYQSILGLLKGDAVDTRKLPPFKAVLISENSNKFDKLAVRVDIYGKTVGYLSKEDARKYRKIIKRKKITELPTSCDAVLTGGFEKRDGSFALLGVCLDIDLYDEYE